MKMKFKIHDDSTGKTYHPVNGDVLYFGVDSWHLKKANGQYIYYGTLMLSLDGADWVRVEEDKI